MAGATAAAISAALRSWPGVSRDSMPGRLPDSPIARSRDSLHAFVLRAAASFWRHPVDDLIGIHDVARLAVHAVRRVDLQFARAVPGVDHLVDVGRTEADARVAVLLAAARRADAGIVDDEVRRLILGMARAGIMDPGHPIERQLPIDLDRVHR